jgi:CubicO group peptidase (beta-lactamase class C family)
MKKSGFLILGSILSCGFIKGQVSTTFPTQKRVTALMNEAMKTSDLPALVAVAINSKNQKITYTFGKAVWTEDTPVTIQHIFRIASMTKMVTSVAALQLVEKGLIGLDDDLSKLLPEMAMIPILSNGQLSKAKNPITLRHLLTHTAGFGYRGSTDKELTDFDYTNWSYKDSPRRFESGTQFLYGSSTYWAGKLVEKISGMDLESYFRKNITGPLGMNRTWFNVPDSLKQYIVSTGSRGADGKQPLMESPDRIPTIMVTDFRGDGGLYSTPEDYTRLLECLLAYGKVKKIQILKKSTILEMNKNQIGAIRMDNPNAFYNPGGCCNLNGITSPTTSWGLAWLIDNEDKPYGRRAGTVLWGGARNTYYYIDFKSGVAASIYTQHVPFNHPATTGLFERFSEIIYAGK